MKKVPLKVETFDGDEEEMLSMAKLPQPFEEKLFVPCRQITVCIIGIPEMV